MLENLLLSLVALAPNPSPGAGEPLADLGRTDGPRSFAAVTPLEVDADGRARLRGAVRSALPIAGDFAVEVRGERAASSTVTIDLGQGVVASLTDGRATLVGPGGSDAREVSVDAAFSLRLLVRGRCYELSVDGVAGPFLAELQPAAAAPVTVEASGGAVFVDRVRIVRAAWREEVEIVGADAARLAALEERPLEAFTLLDPPPSRLAPEFRFTVEGEETPVTVRVGGLRRPAAEIPLLEQALAMAGIRPWMSPRVVEGEPGEEVVVRGETPFGPFDVTAERVVVTCDALIGVGAEWPSLTLWDTEKERIIDRTVPGGPMGRGIEREVPDGTTRMKLVFARPENNALPLTREHLYGRAGEEWGDY